MNLTIQAVLAYLLVVVIATVAQLLILLGPGLILVAMASWLSGLIRRFTILTLGHPLYLLLFGWLGTSTHETGHALFNILFRHEITEFVPFRPAGGEYGHVRFVSPTGIYQKIGLFFVGLAPPLFGTLVIYLASFFLLPTDINLAIRSIKPINQLVSWPDGFSLLFDQILLSCVTIVGFLFRPDNFSKASFWLFVYIAVAVGSSIRPSTPDISLARRGLGVLITALLAFNLATLWMGDFMFKGVFAISQSLVFFYALLIFVIILNLFAIILLRILALFLGVR